MADIGGDDLRLRLLAQPCLDLLRRYARLFDRRSLGHLDLNQHLRPVGRGEELFLDQRHAHAGDKKCRKGRQRHLLLAHDGPPDQSAHLLVARGPIDGVVTALHRLDGRQQLDTHIRGEHHRDDP